jgi:hypothetical protein
LSRPRTVVGESVGDETGPCTDCGGKEGADEDDTAREDTDEDGDRGSALSASAAAFCIEGSGAVGDAAGTDAAGTGAAGEDAPGPLGAGDDEVSAGIGTPGGNCTATLGAAPSGVAPPGTAAVAGAGVEDADEAGGITGTDAGDAVEAGVDGACEGAGAGEAAEAGAVDDAGGLAGVPVASAGSRTGTAPTASCLGASASLWGVNQTDPASQPTTQPPRIININSTLIRRYSQKVDEAACAPKIAPPMMVPPGIVTRASEPQAPRQRISHAQPACSRPITSCLG